MGGTAGHCVLNQCGACVEAATLAPGKLVPDEWGSTIYATLYGTLGDESSLYTTYLQWNLGGCVIGAGGAPATACGVDLMTINACEITVCTPLCAISEVSANNGDPTAFNAFDACTVAADKGACAGFVAAAHADCDPIVNDAGTDPVSRCVALWDLDGYTGNTGVPTGATMAEYIGLTCGGVDAGF